MPPPNELVLIVDDDRAVRNALTFALEMEGLRARAHRSAEDALADPELPDAGCLVVDLHLAAMNGLELVAELRRRHIGIPAVLITTRPGQDIRLKANRLGFGAVLEKPLQDDALFEAVRHMLASVQSLRGSI